MDIKFSIITAVYNGGKTLQALTDSIAVQQYKNYEFIIIDAGSKDDTIDIIKKNQAIVNNWISEPDKGIYDAWNKGVLKATGDWILFLGADDTLNPDALYNYNTFINQLPDKNLHYISSRLEMIDKNGKAVRVKGWKWEWPFFLKMMTVAHPGSLHSKTLFEQFGLYDISYKITGDYELLLRPREKLKTAFMDKVTVKMSEGGASDSVAALAEHYRAAVTTGQGSKIAMNINMAYTFMKLKTKNLLRSIGFNVYLKK